jgi:hypothetical protein
MMWASSPAYSPGNSIAGILGGVLVGPITDTLFKVRSATAAAAHQQADST